MSDAVQPKTQSTFFRRMRYTPLRDALRGRISGRLDFKRMIKTSALPAPAKELILRVVKRTRLWRIEKTDVAHELISHFAEGIAAGETVDALIQSFGEERQAAKLIRRGKRRNRPLAWKMLRSTGLTLAGLLAIYCIVGVYYFLGRATPSVNYIAEINRSVLSVPEDQRAWPIYRKAILAFGVDRSSSNDSRELQKLFDPNSDDGPSDWTATSQWLEQHAGAMELLRQAAARPTLGFVLGAGGSIRDPELWPHGWSQRDQEHTEPLMYVLLPHLHDLRIGSAMLQADAKAARLAGNRARLMRDLVALDQMGNQSLREMFLVNQLVGLGMKNRALEEIKQTLRDRPDLLSDTDLRDLAHYLSGPQNASDLFQLTGERMSFYDAMQRAYTDDGNGDGRLTREGLEKLTFEWTSPSSTPRSSPDVTLALGPAAMLVMDSRKESRELYDSFLDATEAQLAKPLRNADYAVIDDRIVKMDKSIGGKLKHLPIRMFVPSLHRAHNRAEQYIGHRDGAVVAISLELFRRHTGNFPLTLDELVPGLLPSVPADRFTGQPIRYKLIDGKPLLYSVGADLNDDGGRIPHDAFGIPLPDKASVWPIKAETPADGDWVLYPQPALPKTPTTNPAS